MEVVEVLEMRESTEVLEVEELDEEAVEGPVQERLSGLPLLPIPVICTNFRRIK